MRDTVQGSEAAFIPPAITSGRYSRTLTVASEQREIFDRVTAEPIIARHAQPWMLAAVQRFPYTVHDAAGRAILTSEASSGSDELLPGT